MTLDPLYNWRTSELVLPPSEPVPSVGVADRLTEVMNRFPEVEWDRWAVDAGFGYVFGWIDRDDALGTIDGIPVRKDFLALEVYEGHVHGYVTSSASLSAEFERRLGFGGEHFPCRRVEDDLPRVARKARRG